MDHFIHSLSDAIKYAVEQERAGFEHAIDQNPLDSTNHLVYADWLEENGDPEEAAFRRAMGEWVRKGPDDYGNRISNPLPSFRDYSRTPNVGLGRGFSVLNSNMPDWLTSWPDHTSVPDMAGDPSVAHLSGNRFYWESYRNMESALRKAFQASRKSPPS